ncbi:hypothetical protein EYF80_036846 [Liparis tanakae]|uniref:Uncharacterized protein n=1 Tax=Liparis tanakae TaxID=230148 RepID=A0A4Z2GIE9_9TELE|nr:hypothetical protein EYF80_036846 [Liparis tanakae]
MSNFTTPDTRSVFELIVTFKKAKRSEALNFSARSSEKQHGLSLRVNNMPEREGGKDTVQDKNQERETEERGGKERERRKRLQRRRVDSPRPELLWRILLSDTLLGAAVLVLERARAVRGKPSRKGARSSVDRGSLQDSSVLIQLVVFFLEMLVITGARAEVSNSGYTGLDCCGIEGQRNDPSSITMAMATALAGIELVQWAVRCCPDGRVGVIPLHKGSPLILQRICAALDLIPA